MEELKEQLKQGTFYYHKFGLLVKGKVNLVLEMSKDTLNVNFTGGTVDIYIWIKLSQLEDQKIL